VRIPDGRAQPAIRRDGMGRTAHDQGIRSVTALGQAVANERAPWSIAHGNLCFVTGSQHLS
jgi:hypothetical protein